jgi:trigger factor
MAAAVYGDVRRGKVLSLVLERVIIKDTAGTPLSLDDLRGGPDADEPDHDH